MINKKKDGIAKYYIMLFFVVICWGASPSFTKYLYEFNSASIQSFASHVVAVLSLLVVCAKKLKDINFELIKTAGITGLILGIANILQKVGFQYTTPSSYAFLENLSAVVVPLLAIIVYRKRPTVLILISSIMCLLGCAVLCGFFSGMSLNGGDFLCALAGVFYGINIAVTGEKAKKFDSGLYILIQLTVGMIVSLITAIALNFIKINGVPLEPIKFTFRLDLILMMVGVILITNTLCWTLRTIALKHVDSTVVAITMPLSAVLTSIVSIFIGQEKYSNDLLIGALLILVATIASGLSDVFENKKKIQTSQSSEH